MKVKKDVKKDIIGWSFIVISILCLGVVFLANGGDVVKLLTMGKIESAKPQPVISSTQTYNQGDVGIADIGGTIVDKKGGDEEQGQTAGAGNTMIGGGANAYTNGIGAGITNNIGVIGITFGGVILAFIFGTIGIALLKTQTKED